MRMLKWVCVLAAIAIVLSIVAIFAWKSNADTHYFDGYATTEPVSFRLESDEMRGAYYHVLFSIDGPCGPIPSALALPPDASRPAPCVVFLHGINQGRHFLNAIAPPFIEAGFAMATFDQLMCGSRVLKEPDIWDSAMAFRQRPALTVAETRRLVDYLQTRPDIDASRIYLLGASYGAIVGATAAAGDSRIQAMGLVYGGGSLPLLLDSQAAHHELGIWNYPARMLTAWLMKPADPILSIARIAPRPLFFQNGLDDSLIPTKAAEALFAAAQAPKSQRWYAGDHIGLDPKMFNQVVGDAVAWLKSIDSARHTP